MNTTAEEHATRARTLDQIPSLDIDPFDDANLMDPQPLHAQLRDADSMVFLSRYGVPAMARHAEVHAALRDWQTFSSAAGVGLDDLRYGERWRPSSLLLEVDPPVHEKTRTIMNGVMSLPAVRRMKAAFETEAERLADELVARGEFDALKDLAEPFVLKVFPDAVGLREDGREHLLPWGDMAFNSFGPRNDRFHRSTRTADTVRAWIFENSRREAISPGGFGAAIFAAVDAGRLDEDEGEVLVRSMLTAGLDTTVTGLGASILAFARFPDQWQHLFENPQLVRPAFDEVVRWASPVQTFFRTTTRETKVGDVVVPKDQKVLLFLAAANWDERVFHEPHLFDITRRTLGHVGFGNGIHKCVGQMVAKLEAEVVFNALLKRVKRFELLGEPRMHLNNTVRAYRHMHVRVEAR